MSNENTNIPPCGYTHIGGQALIEGVMMRGKNNWALSVRDARGVLHTEDFPLPPAEAMPAWQKWPLVRGVVSLGSSLAIGMRALTISADLASIGTGEATAPQEPEGQLPKGALVGAVVVAVIMAALLFIVAPAAITNLIVGPADQRVFLWNVVDGLLRVCAFFAYILVIGRLPDIKRVFSYHGAEHKTIHCLEHGEELTPENAQRYQTLHVRCGTAFLLMVMVIAILIYTLVPIRLIATRAGITNSWFLLLVVIALRLLLLPLIAGISYEITVKWAGQHENNLLVRAIMWPGLQMQRLTTAEPTDDMLEAAIAATKAVQAAEGEG